MDIEIKRIQRHHSNIFKQMFFMLPGWLKAIWISSVIFGLAMSGAVIYLLIALAQWLWSN
jgi:hypothetical protein